MFISLGRWQLLGRYYYIITHNLILKMQVAAFESPKTYVISKTVNLC